MLGLNASDVCYRIVEIEFLEIGQRIRNVYSVVSVQDRIK